LESRNIQNRFERTSLGLSLLDSGQAAYFAFPDIGEAQDLGLTSIGAEVALVLNGNTIEQQAATWTPADSWKKVGSTGTVKYFTFPLASVFCRERKQRVHQSEVSNQVQAEYGFGCGTGSGGGKAGRQCGVHGATCSEQFCRGRGLSR